MRFSSRIDLWLWAVLAFTLVACAFAVWTVGALGPVVATVVVLVMGVLTLALLLWIVLGTHYELAERDLLISSGPFRWRVPLEQVRAVAPSRSVLSAPALSLDRMRITYGRAGSILISPRNKLQFLEELQRRCPGIEVAGY